MADLAGTGDHAGFDAAKLEVSVYEASAKKQGLN